MKTKMTRGFLMTLMGVLFLLTILPVFGHAGVPQLISYQGKLIEDGAPVTGYRTMTFSLWETDAGGDPASAIWSEARPSLEVVEGVYYVQLGSVVALPVDLSSYDALYLQVDIVHPTEGSQRLSPLLELTSTVFAIKAGDAEALEGKGYTYFAPAIHDHDADYVNEGQADAVTSAMIADSAISSADLGADSVGSSVIADGSVAATDMQDGAALAEIVDNDGAGSTLDADFLDGMDSSAFVLTGEDFGRSGVAANLYEGTSTLTAKYVNATGDTMSGSTSGPVLSVMNTGTGYGVRGTATGTYGRGVYGKATSSGYVTNYGGFFSASGMKGRGVCGYADNDGAVTNYGGFFSARGTYGRGVYGVASGTDGRGVYGRATGAGHGVYGSGTTGHGVYGEATNSGYVTNYGGYFTASGATGRGVYGEAAGFFGHGVYGRATGTSGRGVYGEADNDGDVVNYGGYFSANGTYGRGVYGSATGASGYGVYGSATNTGAVTNYGGVFTASGMKGRGVSGYASDTNATGELVANYGGHFEAAGKYGHGVHGVATGASGFGVSGVATNPEGYSYGGHFWTCGKYGHGVHGQATGTDAYGGYFKADSWNSIGIYAQGGSTGWAADFVGNVRIRDRSSGDTVMELGNGLDYAEGFDVSDLSTIDPGSVLIIDPDNPGKLALSKMPYDTKVAGIAAGANGLGSGVRLGGEEFDQDVALAGRVYCNVDATEVGVEPGDMLTTSSTPGYAMKSTDYMRAHGAILGKAMQELEKGQKGQILVLVTLQ